MCIRDRSEQLTVENNPLRPEDGTREVTFSREVYVEAEDFLPEPIPKYKRLYPGGPECRLKGAYLIRCTGFETDAQGNLTQMCIRDRSGDDDGQKLAGPGWGVVSVH